MRCAIAVLLSVFFLATGQALECYKCESCQSGSENEKATCGANEKCYTMQTTAWIIGSRTEIVSKGCGPSSLCDDKNKAEQEEAEAIRKGPYIVADYAPRDFKCAFCDTDLCNDAAHKP